ncbi:MAG: conjugal transfer protein [Massilioclostridium sp.]|nr:MAG: conjugal transfer protein [Massilioclostridium sp.]
MLPNKWYCCPYCGTKIQGLTVKSNCDNVPFYCKKCKQTTMPKIKNGKVVK